MANRLQEIKHAQRESQLLREISSSFLRIVQDDNRLEDLFINRVALSDKGSMCIIFFYSPKGKSGFEEKRPILVLYKAAIRTALSKMLQKRYTPDLLFKYDEQYEKQRKVDDLLQKLKDEDQL